MTNTFWIITAILIVLAFLFVLYPLLFSRPEKRISADIRNQNLLAYRTRLSELEEEYQQGIIDEENFRMLREELAGSMLDDVGEEQPAAEVRAADLRMDHRRRSTWAVVVVAVVLLPVGVFLLYQEWGALGKVEQYQAMQELQQNWEKAVHIYERVAEANVPAGNEAEKRIEQIRREHADQF